MLGTILVTLIAGTIIGLLGKFVAPGHRDNIPLWLTIICGIGGALIGSYLYWIIFGTASNFPQGDMNNVTRGIDWWRHLWQVLTAAVLVTVAAGATGRNKA